MQSLLELDKVQFDRLNQAIAAVSAMPPKQRERKLHLLQALEAEKQDLMRCNPAIRSAVRIASAAA